MKLKEVVEAISKNQDIVIFDSAYERLKINNNAILRKRDVLNLKDIMFLNVEEILTNEKNLIYIYLKETFKEENYEDNKLYIIDNTYTAQNRFGHGWGSNWYQITKEQIKWLSMGKQIAFNNGEYSSFVSLEEPKDGE